jgi:hypothetical protein
VVIYLQQQHLYAAKLAGLNAAAQRDTTTRILLGAFAASRRQVQQLAVALDRRTHERDERGVALTHLTLRFDSLTQVTRGDAHSDLAGLLTLTGSLDAWDTAGVRVRATADAVIDTARGHPITTASTWTWALERRPFELTVDFSCRRDTALVHVAGPPWAATTVDHAVQRADVCNPPPRWHPFALKLPSVPVATVLVLLGWVLHP